MGITTSLSKDWRVVRRPIPSEEPEFWAMPLEQVLEMLKHLSQVDANKHDVQQFEAKNLYKTLRGLKGSELEADTKTAAEARHLCYTHRNVLQQAPQSMIFERVNFDHEVFPLISGHLTMNEERAFFNFFRMLDSNGRGHICGSDLRKWVSQRSISVSESLFLDFLFTFHPTTKKGFARLEEMVQNVEYFTILEESQLRDFAFETLAKLSGDPVGHRIIVKQLAENRTYFCEPKRAGELKAAGDMAINDKLLMEMMQYSTSGLLSSEDFVELCGRSPLLLFPVKWMQTAFFSYKGLGVSLQTRRLEYLEKKKFLSTSSATSMLTATKTQGQSHRNNLLKAMSSQSLDTTTGASGSQRYALHNMRSRSKRTLQVEDEPEPESADVLGSRNKQALQKQRLEARRLQFQLDAKRQHRKFSKRLSNRMSRDSFFSRSSKTKPRDYQKQQSKKEVRFNVGKSKRGSGLIRTSFFKRPSLRKD